MSCPLQLSCPLLLSCLSLFSCPLLLSLLSWSINMLTSRPSAGILKKHHCFFWWAVLYNWAALYYWAAFHYSAVLYYNQEKKACLLAKRKRKLHSLGEKAKAFFPFNLASCEEKKKHSSFGRKERNLFFFLFFKREGRPFNLKENFIWGRNLPSKTKFFLRRQKRKLFFFGRRRKKLS